MPRKAFKCSVELDIYTVTCPGTRHLTDRNMLYLLVRILGEASRTKSVFATFPLSYNERLCFERTFTNAREPGHVVEILEDENVIFELVQYSDVYKGGKVLARYEQSAREFLYPTPTLTGKTGTDREVLLGRTLYFSGIDPKLEFSSTSTIQETTVPGNFTELRNLSKPSAVQSDTEESDGTSETDEEIVVTPRPKHRLSTKETHCICECPRRPENRGRVVLRSRSLSPSRRPRSVSPTRKPPFKTGKADESIISCRRFPHSRSRSKHRVVVIPEGEPLPCSDCRTPHKDCIVCQAYYKVYGKDFLSYRFSHDQRHHRTTSAPMSEPPRPQLSLTPPEDEALYQSRAYSAPLPLSRRIFPRGSADDYSGSYLSSSNSDEIHERVERIVQKHSPQPKYSRSYEDLSDSDDSLFSLQELRSEINEARMDSLDRSFEDPENPTLGTRLDRSVTVPLSDKKYWSNRKSRFTGRSHRAVLEESMGELYSDLYKKAART